MAKNKSKVVPALEAMAKLISANRLRLEYTECAALHHLPSGAAGVRRIHELA